MSVRRKNIRITPAKLRAQRANAQLSRGPKTRRGRRRSALNRRRMSLDLMLRAAGHERDAYDLRRVWRDLVAAFWFINPTLRPVLRLGSCLERLAYSWWRKLTWLHVGAAKEQLAEADRWVESDLENFLFELRLKNQKTDYWLRKEFGSDGRARLTTLRQSIEARLGSFRDPTLMRAAGPREVQLKSSIALFEPKLAGT